MIKTSTKIIAGGLCIVILGTNAIAGFGRGGSSGRSFSSRSYSAPSRSYSPSPSRNYSRSYSPSYTRPQVVHHYHDSSSSGGSGLGSHLGAGMLGYMMGSANHPATTVIQTPQGAIVQQPMQTGQVESNVQSSPVYDSQAAIQAQSSEENFGSVMIKVLFASFLIIGFLGLITFLSRAF